MRDLGIKYPLVALIILFFDLDLFSWAIQICKSVAHSRLNFLGFLMLEYSSSVDTMSGLTTTSPYASEEKKATTDGDINRLESDDESIDTITALVQEGEFPRDPFQHISYSFKARTNLHLCRPPA